MIYFIPLISAAIGWITNFLAIKMLFYPREERNFIIFKLQGIFPKRKNILAQKLATLVSRKLFSTHSIKAQIATDRTREEISQVIEKEVEDYLRLKLMVPVLMPFINEKWILQLKDRICKELEQYIPKLMEGFSRKIDSVDIEKIVYNRVVNFSSERLEELMMEVIRKELKFIEMAGAVLGFFIGLFQVVILQISW